MDHKTGLENCYVIRGNKKLRFGYTTGSCAAAAAKGAVQMLLGGSQVREVPLMTPKGILLSLELLDVHFEPDVLKVTKIPPKSETALNEPEISLEPETASNEPEIPPKPETASNETEISPEPRAVSCAVRKDAGDDPDNTDGILIYARAEKSSTPGIHVDGGIGVGRVTKPGLSQKIGEAAINPVPKSMIIREAEETAAHYDYEGGLRITIYVPQGEEIARKTFNPRLGIVGGISILGTTGIVEPMSEQALIASIRVEMKQRFCQGEEYLLVTPGNYGAEYLRSHMQLPFEKNIKCSNFVGETIDMAIDMGVKGILFVAHIGKFVKVAAGIMNTHSHSADGRMEILASNAIRAGADLACAKTILDCGTTDEALEVLKKHQVLDETMKEIMQRIQFYLNHRSYERILLGAVVFSNEHGYLGQTEDAAKLIERISEEQVSLR